MTYEAPQARTPFEIDVNEMKTRMDAGEELLIVDVREDKELAICTLPNTVHLPMTSLESTWRDALEGREEDEVIVMCHHGVRSARVCGFLRHHGFEKPRSLVGGIDAWSLAIDPNVQRY